MIPFIKAHACGNDFLIVMEDEAMDHDWAELTRRLCERHTGIGSDGVEFFRWTGPHSGRIRLHNADGSIAEISGNGTRCVAAWMADELGSQSGDVLEIATDAGVRLCRFEARHGHTFEVTSGMAVPAFEAKTLTISDELVVHGTAVSTGNPHFVIVVEDSRFEVDKRSWQSVGEEICAHSDFPKQTNVEFFRVVGPRGIEIRVFERGVGPTTSSGTGSLAAATAAIALGLAGSPLTVVAPGGAQIVAWEGPGTELKLTGPAALIARGEAW